MQLAVAGARDGRIMSQGLNWKRTHTRRGPGLSGSGRAKQSGQISLRGVPTVGLALSAGQELGRKGFRPAAWRMSSQPDCRYKMGC